MWNGSCDTKRKKQYLKTTLDGKQSEYLELFTSGKKKKVVSNEFNDHVVLWLAIKQARFLALKQSCLWCWF